MVVFFGAMALVEDSGYLSRAAWLMDALMGRLGLDGRAFVMQLMGFGCNVPALIGTRVLRNRAARLLSMLVIPFSLCSARLQVFVFITAAVLRPAAGRSRCSRSTSRASPPHSSPPRCGSAAYASREPMLMELPPYRLPTLRHGDRGGLARDVALPAPRHRLHRRRRAADLGADAPAAGRRRPPDRTRSRDSSRRGSRRSSSRWGSIR